MLLAEERKNIAFEDQSVIEANNIWKRFRLYHEKHQSLKEVILKRKRATYEEFWALRDISFKVKKGDALGIIGENGSGKTTLLKILARILRPDKGKYHVGGKVSALLELGAGFHPELTGRENVYLNGSILGLTRREIDARFDKIVAFSGLERFIDMPVKNYSSGMYLRLGFAVAINVDPDILLIDEILAVGDEYFQRKCTDNIFELKNRGKTIILVSHNMESVGNLCDTTIWLKDGEIQAQGDSKEVIDSYLDSVNQEEQAEGTRATEELGSRHGTYEAEIKSVEFLDGQEEEKQFFKPGEKFIARLNYEAYEEIKKPVFAIGIYGTDGTCIIGPNTRLQNQIIEAIKGKGYVEYIMEDLPLSPGTYLFSVAIYDYNLLHPYDHQEKMYMFKVVGGSENKIPGILYVPCKWKYGK